MGLIIGGCFFDDGRNAQEIAEASDVGGAVAVGIQAIVTDAVEALGKDVHQETTDELEGIERHCLPAIRPIKAIVLPTELDAGIIGGD